MTVRKSIYFLVLIPLLLTFCTAPPQQSSSLATEIALERSEIESEATEVAMSETDSDMEEDADAEMEDTTAAVDSEGSSEEAMADDESETEEMEEVAAEDEEAAPTEMMEPTETPEPEPTISSEPITDEEGVAIMRALIQPDRVEARNALDRIFATQDERYTSVLIEVMWATFVGVSPLSSEAVAFTLQEITGENHGLDLDEWIIWYGGTDLTPPPGFATWKGSMLSIISPEFAVFVNDSQPSDMRVEEIRWGGVRFDGIPALDQSPMIPAEEATYLAGTDAVFGLSINGDNRAYPLKIIDWHEMANDVVGGVPVSIAYCTLCGAAIAYDGRANNGETYDFGSSGFLFRSNKLMYDRQTRTLWNQMTGKPVLGELVEEEVRLDILPIVLTSWDEWQARHPDTVVLDVETGFDRIYETGAAYAHYFSSDVTMFPVWQQSDDLALKDQVYAITFDEDRKAYPIDLLIEETVVNDSFADRELVLIAPDDKVLVEGQNTRSSVPVEYSTGASVRAYDRDGHTFTAGDDRDEIIDENGTVWTVTEAALVSEDGEELGRLPGHLAYWLGWYGFFPDTELYEG